jgi:PadR family transcriptional regulator PadR
MAQRKRGAAAREAAARATTVADAREAAREVGRRGTEPLPSELRRRDVLPLLVLHHINAGPTYGNQLMERIAALGAGVVSVNPNTMYPLLRQLEARGLIEGKWEHPERRSRRYYSITPQGRKEYKRLHGELRPLLDSISRSIAQIVREVYG